MSYIPPGYGELQVHGTTDGTSRPWMMSHGVGLASLDQEDLDTVALAVAESDWLDNSSQQIHVSYLELLVGTVDPSAPIHMTASIDEDGHGASGNAPNAAWLVRKGTLLGGRKGRGRTYFPGVTDASVGEGGTVIEGDGTLRIGLEGFWPGVTGAVESITGLYLLHSTEIAPTEVLSWSMDTRLATQRRRMRK